MTKIWIISDEWYPVYSFNDYESRYADADVDIPEETLERWQKVFYQFQEVQDELGDLVYNWKYPDDDELDCE